MKKWLRWQGVIVFVVFSLTLSALSLFFIDSLIERIIEEVGTSIVGAKVELDHADLSFFYAGLTLTRLQVTNPDKPMTNAVEIDHAVFFFDGPKLLIRKLNIGEMTVKGVRLNTPRETSGEITGRASVIPAGLNESISEKFKLPPLKVPDVREILEKEELESLKLVEAVRADIDAEKEKWQKRIKELPDKEKFKEYKKRLKGLMSMRTGGLGGILGGISEALAVKEGLSRDLKRIKTAKDDLDIGMKLFEKRIREAQSALQEDILRLKEKYSLSPNGLANMSKMLLGEKIGAWTQTAVLWYRRLEPFLEKARVKKIGANTEVVKPLRGGGVDVRFKEREPTPDFFIRKARFLKIQTTIGTFMGEIRNVTSDQDILGIPLTVTLQGEKTKKIKLFKLKGTLDHIVPSKSKDSLNFNAQGYQVRDIALSDNKELPITLQEGLADLDLRATLSGEALSAKLTAGLTEAKFLFGGQGKSNPIAKAIISALSSVSKFNLEAEITGTLDNYDIKLKSNLDRVLKDAVNSLVKDQAAQLERRLTSEIAKRVALPLGELKHSFGGLKVIDADLADRIQQATGLL